MPNEEIFNPDQTTAFDSPWNGRQRLLRGLWEFCWCVFCQWTPKPFNAWRLFWLRVFEANIEGKPFVHARARIAIPWHLTLRDRACLGDRANVYSLGEIEIGERATIAQEAYLDSASHDFSQPSLPLTTAKIVVGADAFVGARAFVLPGIKIGERSVVGACSVVTENIPPDVFAAGNPCRILRPR